MPEPFLLIDPERRRLFDLIAAGGRGGPGRFRPWTDAAGVPWYGGSFDRVGLGVTWLGPGWVFDPHAAAHRAARLADLQRAVRGADPAEHLPRLRDSWVRVPRGPLAARLLWAVQRAVVSVGRSVVSIADLVLRTAVWGRDRAAWPKHWRGDLTRRLAGLAWLHVAEWADGDPPPPFGQESALLTHFAALRGRPDQDVCEEYCPLRGVQPHSHFLINVGRGFLGVLEQLAVPDESGVRDYPALRAGGLNALRALGKTGRLVSAYLPAVLGEPAACAALTPAGHRLLQALVRETTRAGPSDPGRAAVLSGNVLPGIGRQPPRACPPWTPRPVMPASTATASGRGWATNS